MPTTLHAIRVPDDRWAQAGDNTKAVGLDRTKWINEALAWLNREPGAKMPQRPPVE